MKKAFFAVLHVTPRQFGKLMVLGTKVTDNMGFNPATFPNPDPMLSSLQSTCEELEILMGEAETGDHQKVQARNKKALEYYSMLQIERNYVNNVAQGDRAVILLSGFDACNDPLPLPVPDTPAIKRIDDGPLPLSAIILLINQSGPNIKKKRNVWYIVQMSTTLLVPESFETVLTKTNSRKLIIPGLVRLQEVFFRVAAMNTHGQSNWSACVSYVPR